MKENKKEFLKFIYNMLGEVFNLLFCFFIVYEL